ncbi:glycoside hydrolase superfamily [Hysterangium stoloniferum]|nr:glycoside hydrolase superfamily [Hysterangium stoloniferum]
MRLSAILCLASLANSALSQQIWDVWQTTWDRQKLFTRQSTNNGLPINFGIPGAIGQADIVIEDTQVFQTMDGFGATLTDSSAKLLSQLKVQNLNNYWTLINQLFNPADGFAGAGLTALRLPIGATDFSNTLYSFDDQSGDIGLGSFSANNAPSYLWSVLSDIVSVNPILKIFLLPWSPPYWMKTSNDMRGGSINPAHVTAFANYLFKSVQALQSKGHAIYAIGIQNEPKNNNPTYPTARVSAWVEAQIATQLRQVTLLDNDGGSQVKIIGYEHNWNDAGLYPKELMQMAGSAFAGVAFHCYAGGVRNQSLFHNDFPSKEVHFTECSGTLGTDWWSNVKVFILNRFIGGPENWSRSAMMWNYALDSNGQPKLPGTNSCGGSGCRGVVTIPGDGGYDLNEEYYVMAQTSRAVLPKDPGGPFAQRIGVTVGGSHNWALRVGAYSTRRAKSTDPKRWTIVVLNWNDQSNGKWKPTSVSSTIEFRGKQAKFTFPVGITTLWWFE